jgi:hypothetical protein
MKSPKHVFISFKTEERDTASKFRLKLVSLGYKVWWAEDLQCGQEWHGEIDKAIEEAGAIIVLWSFKSYRSPWVKHEASEAMAKNVYAPVRIEMLNIESPFSRIQATDIVNWDGEQNHPGFENLLHRLDFLMPKPIPFAKQSAIFIWKEKVSIVLFIIAFLALSMLLKQSSVLSNQIETQDKIFSNVRSVDTLLNKTKDSLDIQFRTVSNLSYRLNDNINTQFRTISYLNNKLNDNISTQFRTVSNLNNKLNDNIVQNARTTNDLFAETKKMQYLIPDKMYVRCSFRFRCDLMSKLLKDIGDTSGYSPDNFYNNAVAQPGWGNIDSILKDFIHEIRIFTIGIG